MEKENRKAQIVELTLQLMRSKGYVAISYDDLAKQLGVTKASIHYHFEKKEDLGAAVIERIIRSLHRTVQSTEPADIKLKEFIAYRTSRLGCHAICPISSLQADYVSLPEGLQLKLQEVCQLELQTLTDILEAGKLEQLILPSENAPALAALILSSIKGAMQYGRVFGIDMYPQVIQQFNRLLLKRIEPEVGA
ncbi:TetR/AcrR family transcriptional regulator [Paenibacillus ferrarius]|uniref:TetR/AcrR family transcriptional regulator n=1 Tax=Paenibacillus ferrarius TaxID=1469647 RepID=UPI003D276DF8